MATNKPRVYNDGVCYVVNEKVKKTDFNAKENSTTAADFEVVAKLMFATQSLREQDIEFGEALSRSITYKIKTPLMRGVTTANKLIIENTLYDIVNVDFSRANNEAFFYLEEVRKLA